MRLIALATAGTVAGSLLVAVPAGQASASCIESGQIGYTYAQVHRTYLPTSSHSQYGVGPDEVGFGPTSRAHVRVAGRVPQSEAAAVVAGASAAASVRLVERWTDRSAGATLFSYAKPVPKGRTARLMLFHEARSFTVSKYQVRGCRIVTLWTSRLVAPTGNGRNVVDLQFA